MTRTVPRSRPPIRGLLLDFGHTLVRYEADEVRLLESYGEIHAYLERLGVSHEPIPDDLMLRVFRRLSDDITNSYLSHQIEELDMIALYEDAFRHFGYRLDRDLLHTILKMDHSALVSQFEVPQPTIDALGVLRASGLKIGLVSNATPLGEVMRHDLEVLGLAPYIQAAVFSSEIGVRKPDPKIYLTVVRALGLQPSECLYVGDRIREDIEGPAALGMRCVLTHEFRQEEPRDDLKVEIIKTFAELPALLGLSVSQSLIPPEESRFPLRHS